MKLLNLFQHTIKTGLIMLFLFNVISIEAAQKKPKNQTSTEKETKIRIFNQLNDSIYHLFESDMNSAFQLIPQIDKLAKSIDDDYVLARYYKILSHQCSFNGQLDSAVFYINKSLETIDNKKNNTSSTQIFRAKLHNALAIIYHNAELYDPAIFSHIKAIILSENVYKKEPKNDTNNRFLSWAYADLAATYSYTPNTNKAKEYFDKAINFSKSQADFYTYGINMLNYGVFLLDIKNIDSALICFNIAQEHFKSENITAELIAVKLNLGKIYKIRKNYGEAKKLVLEANNLSQETGLDHYLAQGYLILSGIYFDENQMIKSLEAAEELNKITASINSTFLLKESELLLSEIHEKLGNYKTANSHLKKYISLSDSLKNLELNNRVDNLGIKFQLEKSKIEYDQLKIQSSTQLEKIERQQRNSEIYILSGIFVLVSFILSLLFFIKQRKTLKRLKEVNQSLSKTSKELIDLNESNNQLFAIISHDLRGPIGTSKSLLEIIIDSKKELGEEEKKQLLKTIDLSIGSTFNLVENLLFWSRTRMNNLKAEMQYFPLQTTVNQVISSIDSTIFTKEIQLKNEIPSNLTVLSCEEILRITFRNIITNAIKFTPRGGQIRIYSTQTEKQTSIHIQDTGLGMSQEQMQSICSKTYKKPGKGTENEPGSGIGLKISIELIEKLGGKLSCESQIKKGSTFTISIPK